LNSRKNGRSSSSNRDDEEKTNIPKRRDYTIGIKSYQIIKGDMFALDDLKSDDEEDESDTEKESSLNSQKPTPISNIDQAEVEDEEGEDEDEVLDLNSLAKAEKVVSTFVNNRETDINVKRLNYLVHILGVLMIGFAVWDYMNLANKVDSLTIKITNVKQSNHMRAEMMAALSNLRDLNLLNRGLFPSSKESSFRSNIINALYHADEIKQTLQRDKASLSTEYQILFDNQVIPLCKIDGTHDMQGLIQATENIVTLGLNLAQDTQLSTITQNNPDYYYIIYNIFNAYSDGLFESSQFYVTEFINESNSNQSLAALLLFIISTALALVIIIPFMYAICRGRDEILRLFLDISDKTRKNLQPSAKTF